MPDIRQDADLRIRILQLVTTGTTGRVPGQPAAGQGALVRRRSLLVPQLSMAGESAGQYRQR